MRALLPVALSLSTVALAGCGELDRLTGVLGGGDGPRLVPAAAHPLDEPGNAPSRAVPTAATAGGPPPPPGAVALADPRAVEGDWQVEALVSFSCGAAPFSGGEPTRLVGRRLDIRSGRITESGPGFSASCPTPAFHIAPGAPPGKTAGQVLQAIAEGPTEPESVVSAACAAAVPGRIAPDARTYRLVRAADDRLVAFARGAGRDETLGVVLGRAGRVADAGQTPLPTRAWRWPHCGGAPTPARQAAPTVPTVPAAPSAATAAPVATAAGNPTYALPMGSAGVTDQGGYVPGRQGAYTLPTDLDAPAPPALPSPAPATPPAPTNGAASSSGYATSPLLGRGFGASAN